MPPSTRRFRLVVAPARWLVFFGVLVFSTPMATAQSGGGDWDDSDAAAAGDFEETNPISWGGADFGTTYYETDTTGGDCEPNCGPIGSIPPNLPSGEPAPPPDYTEPDIPLPDNYREELASFYFDPEKHADWDQDQELNYSPVLSDEDWQRQNWEELGLEVDPRTPAPGEQITRLRYDRFDPRRFGHNRKDSHGDPVESASGEFVYSNTDLTLPWYRTPFVHKRTYRSGLQKPSSMGYAWSHTNDIRLREPSDPSCEGEVFLTTGQGTTLRFTPNWDVASWQGFAPTAVHLMAGGVPLRSNSDLGGVLYRYPDGSAFWHRATGEQVEFDRDGLVRHWRDHMRYGREYEWVTSSHEHDDGFRLAAVYLTSPTSNWPAPDTRHTRISYVYEADSGMLESVRVGNTGVVASYEYDEYGDLRRATDSKGAVEEYTYRRAGSVPTTSYRPRELSIRAACEEVCSPTGAACGAGVDPCSDLDDEWEAECHEDCWSDCGCGDMCRKACSRGCADACSGARRDACTEGLDTDEFQEICENEWPNRARGLCGICYAEECIGASSPAECQKFSFCSGGEVPCDVSCRENFLNCAPGGVTMSASMCEREIYNACSRTAYAYKEPDADEDLVECYSKCYIDKDESVSVTENGYSATLAAGCYQSCDFTCQANCDRTECHASCNDREGAVAACRETCVDSCVVQERVGYREPQYGLARDLEHLLVEVRLGPSKGTGAGGEEERPPVYAYHEYGTDPTKPSFGRVTRQRWGHEDLWFSYWDLGRRAELEARGETPDGSHRDTALVQSRSDYEALEVCPACDGGSACVEDFANASRPSVAHDLQPAMATVVRNEHGHRYTHYYNGKNRLLRTVEHDLGGATTHYQYNEDGTIRGVQASDGSRTCAVYNRWGQVTVKVDFGFDDGSRASIGQAPIVRRTEYTGFLPSKPARIDDPRPGRGVLAEYVYDASFNLQESRNGTGGSTFVRRHPHHGLPVEVRSADGTRHQYRYHSTGQVERVEVGTGTGALVTERNFDDVGRLIFERTPLGATETLTWDGAVLRSVQREAGEVATRIDYKYDGGVLVAVDSCSGDSPCDEAGAPDRETIRTQYDVYLNPSWVTRDSYDGQKETTCFRRRPDGRVLSVIDAGGRRVDTEYDAAGRVVAVKAVAEPWTPVINALGGLPTQSLPCSVRTDGPAGELASYEYDAFGLKRSVGIAGGMRQETEIGRRDRFGRAADVYDVGRGALLQRKYDELGNVVSEEVFSTDPLTRRYGRSSASKFEYDDANRLVRVHEWQADEQPAIPRSDEWVTVVEYDLTDAHLGVARVTDADGYTVETITDDAGRPIEVRFPTGDVRRTDYADGGRVVTSRWPAPGNGGQLDRTTRLTEWGAVAEISTSARGGIVLASTQFDSRGRPETTTSASGQRVTVAYDRKGRVRSRTTAHSEESALTIAYGYDRAGRVEREMTSGPATPEATTTYEYDALGRVLRVDRPDGVDELYHFEADNLTTQPNRVEKGEQTLTYELDTKTGRVEQVTARRGLRRATLSFVYDQLGRVRSATRGDVTSELRYNTRGVVASEGHSLLGPSGDLALGYDRRGNLDRIATGGLVGRRAFDGLGRLVEAWAPSSENTLGPELAHRAFVELEYQGLGGPTVLRRGRRRSSPVTVTAFEYDDLGALDGISVSGTGWQAGRALAAWDYGTIPVDGAPRIANLELGGQRAVSSIFEVDNGGRVTFESHDGMGTEPHPPSYEPIPTTPTFPAPTTPIPTLPPVLIPCGLWGCDLTSGVAVGMGGGASGSPSAGFAAGSESSAAAGTEGDDAGAHAAASPAAGDNFDVRVYELDGRANWLERSASHPNLLDMAPDITVGDRYTGLGGEFSGDEAVEVAHDEQGRVIALRHREEDGSSHEHERYEYDAFGLLVRARNGAVDRLYTYDAFGRRIAERDGDTNKRTVYGYAGPHRLLRITDSEEVDGPAIVDLTIDGGGLDDHLFTVFSDGRVHHYHRDRRNSVYLVTDENGEALERYHHTAYGETVVFSPDGTVLDATAIGNRFGFQGHVFDAEIALVDMRARFYRPAWGRFLSPDPIGLAGGPNLYAFVGGRMLTHWDPLGLKDDPIDFDRFADVRLRPPPRLGQPGPVARWVAGSAFNLADGVIHGVGFGIGEGPLYNLSGQDYFFYGGQVFGSTLGMVGDFLGMAGGSALALGGGACILLTSGGCAAPGGAVMEGGAALTAAGFAGASYHTDQMSDALDQLFFREADDAGGGVALGGRHDDLITYDIRPDIKPQAGTRQTGIDRAWRLEKELVEKTGKGTHDWTPQQAQELIDNGKVKGFTGHHINSVADAPEWAGDPRNIRFLSTKPRGGDHLRSVQGHRGNYQNPTSGRLIDREAMLRALFGG